MILVLYIAGTIALIAITAFAFLAMRTLGRVDTLIGESQFIMHEVKKDLDQMSSDVSQIRMRMTPVLDNIADVTERLAYIAEGAQTRVEGIYDTIDDALDVARGAIDDIERVKNNLVDTIDKPLEAAKRTSSSFSSSIVKGFTLVRDIVDVVNRNRHR